jgi:hypothetical protein
MKDDLEKLREIRRKAEADAAECRKQTDAVFEDMEKDINSFFDHLQGQGRRLARTFNALIQTFADGLIGVVNAITSNKKENDR